jgi:hypothetical protein
VGSRVAVGRGTVIPRGGAFVGGAGSRVVVGSRFVGAGPSRFYRPYYAFRPRLSLGFGLWVGYPVTYPYYGGYPYPDAYAYASPNPYPDPNSAYPAPYYGSSGGSPEGSPTPNPSSGYPPPGYPSSGYPSSPYPSGNPSSGYPPPGPESSVGVQPGTTASGGVSFEISPATAMVYVDGTAAGAVADFTPTSQPLALAPGRHRIEVRAPGYQTIVVDADVKAGEVTPYQGTMEPSRQ